MAELIEWDPRGVLHPNEVQGTCRVWRFAPCEVLGDTLAHIWAVAWDLRGQEPLIRETLPHPTVHVVFETRHSGVFGVTTKRFTRTLEGQGWALGLKFHPGCFSPFSPRPITELTDRTLSLNEGFGIEGNQIEDAVLKLEANVGAAAERAEAFLISRLPEPNPETQLARRIVRMIFDDSELTRVQEVATASGIGLRTIQRIFKKHVGVSPKWVIQRYRLHEAVSRLNAGTPVDLTALALDLGFFDQAHLTREFKALVGRAPMQYVESLKEGGSRARP